MDSQKFIQDVIKNDVHCYFISPHLDDAVFSAGELMHNLSSMVKVDVINVFTSSGDGNCTLSARAYLNQCKSVNPSKLFEDRLAEDSHVLHKMGVKIHNLGFVDGLWRRKQHLTKYLSTIGKYIPESISLYPTYRWHLISGNIHIEDDSLIIAIRKRIKDIINGHEKYIIFCPIGYGQHIDHLVVRNACSQGFTEVIYWNDLPYSLQMSDRDVMQKHMYVKQFELITTQEKQRLCRGYISQYDIVLQEDTAMNINEVYSRHL